MASPQELQNALMLKKANPNLTTEQVVNQARVPVTTTSNQDQLAANRARVQSQIASGERPAVGTSATPQAAQVPVEQIAAPIAPTTTPSGATMAADGTVTPSPATTPTPTPITPTAVTPTTPVLDKNAEIKAKNEAQMALNKQQADLKEQERQKITQETAVATTPTDTQGILSSFISGVPVAPQKSGNYINAKFQYDQYSKLNAMTPTQLLDNLKQGQIGTEMDKLLSQNPNYIQAKGELDKIQKTNNINNSIKNIYGGVTGQTTQTPDYLGMVSKDLMTKLGLDKDMTSAEAFSQYVTGDQKIVDYTNQLSNVNRQIADTSKLINDGIKELKARKGDMPADALVVLLNSTFKDVNETLTNLNNTKTYLEADLKNASEMAFNRYTAVSKDIDNARTIKNSVISNLIQSQFNLAGKMQENELANQIARESMNDPYKAIPAMIEEYKKLGIPFTRSTQQIIQDFESSGKDLSTYLSELQGTIQSKPEYQKIRELQAGQLSDSAKMKAQQDFDIQKIKLQDSMKDRNIQRVGGTNDNPIYGYIDGNKVVTVSVPGSTTTGTTPTGNIVPVTAGNKTVRLDQVGATGFESAINQLKTAGIPIVVGEGHRNQTDTIKSMADRYGIPFNASNPSETAGKLRKAGHQVADPGKSNHESGMAIDVYGSSKLDAVTPEQEKILNANGWYSAGIPGDAGHFEYRGGVTGTQGQDIKMQALSLTQGLGGTADERQAFADNVIKVAQRDNISLADAKKKLGYKSADDVEFGKARGAEFKSIKSDTRDKLSNASTALTLLNSPQTAIGDVASIVGFLKTIDPASVARESEVDSVRNARGIIDSLSNQFAQLKEGTKLTDNQRKQLKDSIQTIVDAGNTKYYEYIRDTEQEFKDRGLDPTVYISKTELGKARGGEKSNIAPVSIGLSGTDLFSEWKNFNP